MKGKRKQSVRDRLRQTKKQLQESERHRSAVTQMLLAILTAAEGEIEIPKIYYENPAFDSAETTFTPDAIILQGNLKEELQD